ncbi:hypothetical protein SPRG_13483 [Saprolegnia parasitica CBS 223.65]|uniref:Uncharacterized protein n=1 Tax=Saprolegnia parasitica (strain CBS 223.65) TaxID=695850 RepID=A0A067BQ07_SAPPC|nr:hypothetical protein SPRG_13483 [Saprolegnia parasitica CBS 223.65]KDO20338.1 hypothetical protein SPRG_13483 [Saprolegnia parasitica CBS 223.65]|eukprot:XP_012208936.1 hypothetical protein SPRG_13483 [Saprolegnia parasitica CBS 223.65]
MPSNQAELDADDSEIACDVDLYVSDDGTIAEAKRQPRVVVLERQLSASEKELHQAAEYGMQLLHANDELQATISRLHVEHDTSANELQGELRALQRHLLAVQSERDSWKQKYIELDEAVSASSLEPAPITASFIDDQVAAQLAATLSTLEGTEQELAAIIVENDRLRAQLSSARAETREAHEQLRVHAKLGSDSAEALQDYRREMNDQLHAANTKIKWLQQLLDARDQVESQLHQKINDLTLEVEASSTEFESKANLMQSMLQKCARLEKELSVFEQVMSNQLSPVYTSSHEAMLEAASFDRLQNFFNLTALGIVLEMHAEEYYLDTSSRKMFEIWFQQVLASDLPFQKWAAWLTHRISNHMVATSPSSHSPSKGRSFSTVSFGKAITTSLSTVLFNATKK